MDKNNSTITLEEIKKEIKLKRYNPDYLSKLLLESLDQIRHLSDNSLSDTFRYGKKLYIWKKKIRKPANQMDELIEKTNKIVKLVTLINEKHKQGEDVTKLDEEFENLSSEINYDIDFNAWDFKELDGLMLERQRLLAKNSVGGMAISAIFNNDVIQKIGSLIVFSLTFFISYIADDYIVTSLQVLGPFYSRLIPAALLYMTLDQLMKRFETWISWKRVEYLLKTYVATVMNLNKQVEILKRIRQKRDNHKVA